MFWPARAIEVWNCLDCGCAWFVGAQERQSLMRLAALLGLVRYANLPNRLTRMVRRDNDIRKVSTQLSASRFVTIVGAGGVGKTTVAVAVGHDLFEAFASAVLFIDLGMLSDPDLAATVLASMLGLSVQSNDATPTLIAFLRDKRILLIINTCEHLVEAVARLAGSLVDAAPQVHILATSREALRVESEHIYRLDALASPADDSGLTAAAMQTFPATRLFVERAAASGARLDVSDAEAPIIAGICRKLDGVALAIELAARRVESYGLRQTAALLDQRLALLWVGSRTAPPRQMTLQATLDWSLGLLSEAEGAVLRRLAAFVGHFTLDAALEVATGASLDRSRVLSAIDSLVAKSILATRPIGAMVRYRLLDTMRAYVLEMKSDEAGAADVAARHAAYYRRWLEQCGIEWSSSATGEERILHFAAIDNVRAALEWCFGPNGNVAIGVGLAAAAAPVLLAMSLFSECRRWSEQAMLALDDATRGGSEEMHLQAGLGISLMYTLGNNEQSYVALMRGLELAEKLHNPVNQLRLMGQLNGFHRRAGNLDRMLSVAQRSEALAREMADPIGTAAAQAMIGVSHHLIGNHVEARAHLEAALAQAPASTSAKGRPFDFHYERPRIVMARTLWILGYPDRAARVARETIDGLAATEPVTTCIVLLWGASVFLWTGDLTTASECIDRVIPHAERHGLTPYLNVASGRKGELLIQRGEIETGVELLRNSLAILDAERMYAMDFCASLAQGLAMLGRFDETLPIIDNAIARVKPHGELLEPELLRIRGEVLERASDAQAAERAFRRSIELADQQSALSWRLRASINLARLQFRQDRREEAREALAETYARFSEGFHTANLKAAERLLATLR